MPVAARIARSFLPQQAGPAGKLLSRRGPVLTGKPLPPAPPFPVAFPLIFPGPALPAGRQVRPCPTKIRLSGGSLLQLLKVVADSGSHRILGAQMMCARATDMISQFAVAMANGLTLEDMAKVIFPHPTFSEGILEAVR